MLLSKVDESWVACFFIRPLYLNGTWSNEDQGTNIIKTRVQKWLDYILKINNYSAPNSEHNWKNLHIQ